MLTTQPQLFRTSLIQSPVFVIIYALYFKANISVAGEMVQELREHTVLLEDQSLATNAHCGDLVHMPTLTQDRINEAAQLNSG